MKASHYFNKHKAIQLPLQETKGEWWPFIVGHKAPAGVYLLRQPEFPQQRSQTGWKVLQKGPGF